VNLLATLLVLLVLAWALAHLVKLLGLPPLLGMLAAGVVVATLLPEQLLPVTVPMGAWRLEHVAPEIRQAVLAVVLLRAGLSLSRQGLRQAGPLALKLGLLPLLGDVALLTVAAVGVLDLSIGHALVLGFTVAAISPAIVIPGVLELLAKRSGKDRRLPTALLTGAPLDNIACLLLLTIVLDVALGRGEGFATRLLRLPLNLVMSMAAGVAAGWLISLADRAGQRQRAVAMLSWTAAAGLIALGRWLDFSYVLAIITAGVVVRARSPELADRLSRGLVQIWSVTRYALFGLIGAAVDLGPLASVGLLAVAVIVLGQCGRAGGSLLATIGEDLSGKQRLAGVLCYVPKATIQAAFGSMALDAGLASGDVIVTVAILSIVICAPLGVVGLHRIADGLLPGARLAAAPSQDATS